MLKYGGSFAPPITDAALAGYLALAASAQPQIAEAMRVLHSAVTQHKRQVPSRLKGTPHPVGIGTIVPLEPAVVAALDQHLPWDEELDLHAALFEKISNETDKPLRDAAFHLLWYARELALGREPLTKDTL